MVSKVAFLRVAQLSDGSRECSATSKSAFFFGSRRRYCSIIEQKQTGASLTARGIGVIYAAQNENKFPTPERDTKLLVANPATALVHHRNPRKIVLPNSPEQAR